MMEESPSKKRRRDNDPEAITKRKKKKQKTSASTETMLENPLDPSPRVNGHFEPAENTATEGVKPKKTKKERLILGDEDDDNPFAAPAPRKPKVPADERPIPSTEAAKPKKAKKSKSHSEDAVSLAEPHPLKSDEAPIASIMTEKHKKKKKKRHAQLEVVPEVMTNGAKEGDLPPDSQVPAAASNQEMLNKSRRKHAEAEEALESTAVPAAADIVKPKSSKKKRREGTELNSTADAVPAETPKKSKKRRAEAAAATTEEQAPRSMNGEAANEGQPETMLNGAVEEPDAPDAVHELQPLEEKTEEPRKRRKQKAIEVDSTLVRSKVPVESNSVDVDAMDIDSSPPARPTAQTPQRRPRPRPTIALAKDEPSPIVVQTQSIWIPLWPQGWNQPLESAIEQHLKPRLHRFDETLKGVLLAYKNVCLNDRPTREGAATDNSGAVNLVTVNEYGVGYCWLIADLDLFVPKRGVQMIGEIVFQNAGHIGVLCWDKFNASIEEKRLPRRWKFDKYATPLPLGAEGKEHQSPLPGSWLDENGERIRGKIKFRIINFDVGLNGDHAFLCIEGSMLSEKSEAKLREKELRELRSAARSKYLKRSGRELPEYGFTDLGVDESAAKKGWENRTPRRRRWQSEPQEAEPRETEPRETESEPFAAEAVDSEAMEPEVLDPEEMTE